MHSFERALRAGWQSCGAQGPTLLAVSGGADSVALLRACTAVPEIVEAGLVVAHLHHGLRAAADHEAEFVRQLAESRSLPVQIERLPVRSLADAAGWGLEEGARKLRYDFLSRVAQSTGCHQLAVAHTADDQVETVLHHLFRGSGLRGVSGIPPVRILPEGLRLIRPLLSVTRSAVCEYLQSLGQTWCEDESNQDESLTRVRIRRQLLPQLEQDYNPRVRDAVLRLQQQAHAAQEAVEWMAEELWNRVCQERSPHWLQLDCCPLVEVPRHLVREIFVCCWKKQSWPRQGLGFAEWERLASLALGGESHPISLPGMVRATRAGESLRIERSSSLVLKTEN